MQQNALVGCVLAASLCLTSGLRAQVVPGDEPLCLDVIVGGFPGWSDHPADSLYYRPPPRVRLNPATNADWSLMDVPDGSLPSPHRRTLWRLAGDTLRLFWSTGFYGVEASLVWSAGSYKGKAGPFTDVAGQTQPTAVISAAVVPCRAPAAAPAIEMRRFLRALPLSDGTELRLGETVPETVVLGGQSGTTVVNAQGSGWAEGAETIRVRRGRQGQLMALLVQFAAETRPEQVRARIEGLVGSPNSSESETDFRSWRWDGRAEAVQVSVRRGRVSAFIEDPRVPWG